MTNTNKTTDFLSENEARTYWSNLVDVYGGAVEMVSRCTIKMVAGEDGSFYRITERGE